MILICLTPAIIFAQVDVNKGCLPSPEDLKYKILIKAKRSKKVDKEEKTGSTNGDQENVPSETGFKSPLEETIKMARRISVKISRGSSPDETSGIDEENAPDEKNALDENVRRETNVFNEENAQDKENGLDDKNTDQKSCNGNIPQKGLENGVNDKSIADESSNVNSGHMNEEKGVIEEEIVKDFENPVENVSCQLNSIINCLEATKFVQLDDPDRQFWQMFSLKENAAEVLGNKQESAMKLVALTQRGLARVYPANTRVDSSNYNPIPFWMW